MSETLTLPPLIDIHVHYREPGINPAETIESGTRAAIIGGYALTVDMSNNPGHETWSRVRVEEKHDIHRLTGYGNFATHAGSQPDHDNIHELEGMMELCVGTKGYGGETTSNSKEFEAIEFEPIIKELKRVAPEKPYLFHAGENNLSDMIDLVAGTYGLSMHVCHVNDPEEVDLVTRARDAGLDVTCGVCPHHILKTSHDLETEGQFAAMKPPLAHQTDTEKLMYLLAKGYIQIIETDHAPHTEEAKWLAEETGGTCYGVPGIEHAVPLMLYQVKRNNLTRDRLVDAMSIQPARLLGLHPATGSQRSYTEWSIKPGIIRSFNDSESGAGWTPYAGMQTGGRLLKSVIGGQGKQRIIANRGAAI
jgi:dihydroorotase-like cyclic amidohydrolase